MILVVDACTDRTAEVAEQAARERWADGSSLIEGPGHGAGAARRAGMDLAADRLLAHGRERRPGRRAPTRTPDPLRTGSPASSRTSTRGAGVVAGLIELDPEESQRLRAGGAPPAPSATRRGASSSSASPIPAPPTITSPARRSGSPPACTAPSADSSRCRRSRTPRSRSGWPTPASRSSAPPTFGSARPPAPTAAPPGAVGRPRGVVLGRERRRYVAGAFPPERCAGTRARHRWTS